MPDTSGDIPHIRPSQAMDGDLVIRLGEFGDDTGITEESIRSKLGELGLPPEVVAKLKTAEETVDLLPYDPETQPALEKSPWQDFEDFMDAKQMEPTQRGLARSLLASINRQGTGRGGQPSYGRAPSMPILYLRSSGEVFKDMYLDHNQDMSDILIDVAAIETYLRNGDLELMSNVGPAKISLLTEFVNGKIEALPEGQPPSAQTS